MRDHIAGTIASLFLCVSLAGCADKGSVAAENGMSEEQSIIGIWRGPLSAPGVELSLIFRFEDSNGEIAGYLSIPQQRAYDIEMDQIGFDGRSLEFVIDKIGVRYWGKLESDAIQGVFEQGGVEYTLNLNAWELPADVDYVPIVGTWQGAFNAQGGEFRIALRIEDTNYGPVATLNVPEHGLLDVVANQLSFDDTVLSLSFQALGAEYEARLVDGGLTGKWQQGGAEFDLNLGQAVESATPLRPQHPNPPFPYRQEDVKFDSSAGEAVLAGTLTLPEGEGPFPAAILISGSGLQDRDETILGHKPFLVIADHLTRNGIAVLRYDDRGVFESTGDGRNATLDDFAEDLRGGVAFLDARDDISSIGLIGHSEGGAISDRVASSDDTIRWTIRMGGASVSGLEVLHEQSTAVFLARGGDEAMLPAFEDFHRKLYALATAGMEPEKGLEKARALIAEMNAGMDDKTRAALGIEQADQSVAILFSPWFQHFLQHDPADDLRQVKVPVFAMYGEKDVQILPSQNQPVAAAALQNPASRTHVYPNLNHLFQTTQGTGGPEEYAAITETIAPVVLDDIVQWINAHGRELED